MNIFLGYIKDGGIVDFTLKLFKAIKQGWIQDNGRNM